MLRQRDLTFLCFAYLAKRVPMVKFSISLELTITKLNFIIGYPAYQKTLQDLAA